MHNFTLNLATSFPPPPNSNSELKKHNIILTHHYPNPNQVLPLLESCNSLKQLTQIHALALKTRTDKDPRLLFKILRLCSALNSLDYASQIFARIENRDVFHYTALIGGKIDIGSYLEAIQFFKSMLLEYIVPDSMVISYILKACSLNLELEMGKQVHGQVIKLSMSSKRAVRMRLMEVYAKCIEYDNAKLVFEEMPHRDVIASTILISSYSDHGLVGKAIRLFNNVLDKDIACWTAIIDGCVRNNKANEALDLFRAMQSEKIKPNGLTLVCVLSACAQLGALECGKWVHFYIKKSGLKLNMIIGSALINMYVRCGNPDDAQQVFDEMPERDIICYNSIITGLAMNGRSYQAIELYKEMINLGKKPTRVTFIGVLNACSHGGLINIGYEIFESMQRDFKIRPSIEHYGCMVDLLGRVGKLLEAYEFIQKMKIKPDHIIWGSLLSACRIHGDLKLAEKVAKHLFDSNTADSGTYILLSSLYASFGKWNEAVNLRERMKERKIQKVIGCSSIEINNEIHEFFSGDIKHPKREQIYKRLEKLDLELRENGYKPDKKVVLHDLEEDSKDRVLAIHSERLAICFGLICTKDGETLRIVKNLRICSDCHVTIKIISKMTKRKIVVRDRNRFHHFEDGFCSCGDYW